MAKQKDWTFRLYQEAKKHTSVWFLTLTYNDENVPLSLEGFPVVSKSDVQLWLKRLRSLIEPVKIRYFLTSEYGPNTLRPHYHAILFGLPGSKPQIYEYITKTWNKGFITLSPVNIGRFSYVAKYTASSQLLPDYLNKREFRPFLLCSRRPGIGSGFLDSSAVRSSFRERPRLSVRFSGYTQRLPRYYKDKLYDSEMKEQLSELTLSYNVNLLQKQLDYDYSRKSNKNLPYRNYLAPTPEEVDAFNRQIIKKIKQSKKL